MNTERLFVYGTLRDGYRNPFAQSLQEGAARCGRAIMPGALYLGGDASFLYPKAAYRPETAEWVQGEVYELHGDGALLLAALDRYEGVGPGFPEPQEYVRRRVWVQMEGRSVETWCYVMNEEVDETRRIVGGDFTTVVPLPDT